MAIADAASAGRLTMVEKKYKVLTAVSERLYFSAAL